MKNITEKFKKIIASNVDWAFSIFYLVLETLENNGVNVSFWEGEENWASIQINNKLVGYIWKKYPLIIIENEIASEVKEFLNGIEDVYYIEVNCLIKDLFRIEDDEVKGNFENFNKFDSFTMEDLWFQTNSR